MTIATVGHRQPLLTINTGVAECGDISDGIGLAHHGGMSTEGWLANSEGWWVISFADLETINHTAVAKRAAKQGETIPEALTQQGSTADVEQSVESEALAHGEAAPDGHRQHGENAGQGAGRLRPGRQLRVCLSRRAGGEGGMGGGDAREEISRVLGDAYDKLLNAKRNVREALKALGQDCGK